jgi:hypothetical protein
MKNILYTIILSLFFSFNVFADQWIILNENQALAAVKLTSGQNTLMKYCKPCGFTPDEKPKPTEIIVKQVSAWKIVDRSFPGKYYFLLNDLPYDLAYLYYFKEGQWRNVAIALGLETSGVDDIFVKPIDYKVVIEQCEKNEDMDSGITARMHKAAEEISFCLEELIADLNLEMTDQSHKETLSQLESLRNSYTALVWNYANNRKDCAPWCGSMFALYPTGNYISLLKEILNQMVNIKG